MKKNSLRIISAIVLIAMIFCTAFAFSGCAGFSNEMKNIKGELIGNQFDINFYDNNGNNILNIEGKKVGLASNYVETKSVDSEGTTSTNYELSSVITLTVDGHQVNQTGNTIVFVEDGIKQLEDFSLPETISTDGGTINIIDRNINKIKNVLGTPKVVVVCSQLGIPIAVYGGEKVYWEIPDDLPKMTKLNIDGKALYIHRANYILLDSEIVK